MSGRMGGLAPRALLIFKLNLYHVETLLAGNADFGYARGYAAYSCLPRLRAIPNDSIRRNATSR